MSTKKLKTILVAYLPSEQPTKLTDKEVRLSKLYAFNTSSELKERDIIKTPAYKSPIQVVEILEESFVYYNPKTGELANTISNTQQRRIANLEIREENETETIFGTLI